MPPLTQKNGCIAQEVGGGLTDGEGMLILHKQVLCINLLS